MPKHRRRSEPDGVRRIASATLVCAATTGAVLGTTQSAGAATHPPSATQSQQTKPVQKFRASTGQAKPGQVVRFAGQLYQGGKPVANRVVKLQASAPGNPWHTVHKLRTDANGVARVNTKVHTTGQWRMVLSGDLHDRRITPTKTVHVQKPLGKMAVAMAARQAGKPYAYGATGPSAFDCSGLTRYVYGKLGVHLPHSSSAQYSAAKRVAKGHARKGDLLFFHDGGSVYHVAIYAGNHRMWTAPQSGDVVKLQSIYDGSYYVGRPY